MSTFANIEGTNKFPVICGVFEGSDMNLTDDHRYCSGTHPFKIVAFTLSKDGDIKRSRVNEKCYETVEEADYDMLAYKALSVCKE
ncbi:MAG: hypothetical protein AB8E15_01450 [Bdellovibrionales bacterium]